LQIDWESQRLLLIDTLQRLLSLNAIDNEGNARAGGIRYLWQPPIIDENFAEYRMIFEQNIMVDLFTV
jgi:hypothetical protein